MASALLNIPDSSADALYVKIIERGEVKYCGFKREYIAQNLEEIDKDLIDCKVCFGIMREPSICNGEITCLVCSERSNELTSVKDVQQLIAELKIKCPLLGDCDWNGWLWEAEPHLESCRVFKIRCELCEQIITRGERDSHRENFCQMRYVECACCASVGKAKGFEEHSRLCPEYPIFCPNNCGEEFARKELRKHKTKCLLERIRCPYTEYGCKAKSMLRKDLLAHKKEYIVEHTDITFIKIDNLEFENQCLMKAQDEIVGNLNTVGLGDDIKWDIITQNMARGENIIQGPMFYVKGYKLRLYAKYNISVLTTPKMNFFLARINGEFDKELGEAIVTRYRLILVDRRNYLISTFFDGPMNYKLVIGKEGVCFRQSLSFGMTQPVLSVRINFDISIIEETSTKMKSKTFSSKVPFTTDPFEHKNTI